MWMATAKRSGFCMQFVLKTAICHKYVCYGVELSQFVLHSKATSQSSKDIFFNEKWFRNENESNKDNLCSGGFRFCSGRFGQKYRQATITKSSMATFDGKNRKRSFNWLQFEEILILYRNWKDWLRSQAFNLPLAD